MAGSFERDFGYLMPFLDKIEAAAKEAPAPTAAELSELLRGEKARWARIQALLTGAPPQPSRPAAPASSAHRAPAAEASGDAPRPGTLTVGSLRRG